jgi:hypothetical protein
MMAFTIAIPSLVDSFLVAINRIKDRSDRNVVECIVKECLSNTTTTGLFDCLSSLEV